MEEISDIEYHWLGYSTRKCDVTLYWSLTEDTDSVEARLTRQGSSSTHRFVFRLRRAVFQLLTWDIFTVYRQFLILFVRILFWALRKWYVDGGGERHHTKIVCRYAMVNQLEVLCQYPWPHETLTEYARVFVSMECSVADKRLDLCPNPRKHLLIIGKGSPFYSIDHY